MKKLLATFAVCMAFSMPAMAEHFYVTASEPDDDTYEALVNFIIDDYGSIKEGDVIHYTDKTGKKSFFYNSLHTDNGQGMPDFTNYGVTAPNQTIADWHSFGWTGKGFNIHNAATDWVATPDDGIYYDILDPESIAPGVNFKEAKGKAVRKRWSVKLQKNGVLDNFIEFKLQGSNRHAARAFQTAEAAKGALIWHKMYNADSNEIKQVLKDATITVDFSEWDGNGTFSSGDYQQVISLEKAVNILSYEIN